VSHAPAPTARSEVAAGQLGAEIYVVGGFTADGRDSRKVEVYDAAADRWHAAPDYPIGVHHTAVVGVGTTLFVFGGATTEAFLPTPLAFKLAPGAAAWTPIAPLPAPRLAHAAAVVDGKVYIVGGLGGDRALARTVDVYDPVRDTWGSAPDLPTGRDHLTAVEAGGRVLVLGGDRQSHATDLDVVEALDPARGRWETLSPMPVVRGAFSAAVWRGLVVATGGENDTEVFASTFGYDPAADRWLPLPSLATPRHGFGAASWGDRFYVLLGGPRPGLAVTPAVESLGPSDTARGVGMDPGPRGA
jgi:hypothetical protein